MENIRYIKLKNKGGFVAKITVQYKGILTVTEIFAPRQNAPLTLLTQIFRTAHR